MQLIHLVLFCLKKNREKGMRQEIEFFLPSFQVDKLNGFDTLLRTVPVFLPLHKEAPQQTTAGCGGDSAQNFEPRRHYSTWPFSPVSSKKKVLLQN
jgi:hypothetical protein